MSSVEHGRFGIIVCSPQLNGEQLALKIKYAIIPKRQKLTEDMDKNS